MALRWPLLSAAIDRAVDAATRIAYPGVPHTPAEYLARVPRLTVAKKYLHKRLALWRASPRGEWSTIPAGSRVLWLHTGKPSFGDTIMELSCRKLLKGRDFRVELLTVPKLAPLFAEDDVFARVHTDPAQIDPADYDVVLLQEYNHPSLRLLRRHFRHLPHACLFRYFYGPDRNQTGFGFHAANRVFGLGLSPSDLDRVCAPYLQVSEATRASVRPLLPQSPFLALALGGLDPLRTYNHWPEVLALWGQAQLAESREPLEIVLLGSDNGVAMQDRLMQSPHPGVRLTPLVGRLPLLQSQAVTGLAQAFIGCDGGLMHLAHTTGVPSVTLFASGEPPHLRLSPGYPSEPIYSAGPADLIEPAQVVDALTRLRANHQRVCDNSSNSSA